MVFLFSQILGLIIFCAVNFGLFCFIFYKRNQAFRVSSSPKPIRYHFATALLVLFFSFGFGYRIFNIRDGVEQLYLTREVLVREEKFLEVK